MTDPAEREIHAVDIASGEKTATGALPEAPNENATPISATKSAATTRPWCSATCKQDEDAD